MKFYALPHFLEYHAIWLMSLLRHLFGQRRFAAITPPFFQTQRVYDRHSRKTLSLNLRNYVDWFTLKQIFLDEDYNLARLKRFNDINSAYQNILKNSKTPLILDIGGNIGLSATYFNLNFPDAKILMIEPEAGNIIQAKKNINTNKVHLVQGAISCSNSVGRLLDVAAPNNAFRVIEDPKGDITFYSVDSLIDEQKKQGCIPFIIKIDIEGHENSLFKKSSEWIDSFPLLIIELHDWMLPGQAYSRNFLSAISKRDRDFIHHGENIFSISNEAIK